MSANTTPTSTCTTGHTHASWYAAQACDRGLESNLSGLLVPKTDHRAREAAAPKARAL